MTPEEIIKSKNIKMTGQRQEILCLLREKSNEHLSAEELHAFLKARNSRTGIATVYRTLALLEGLDVVRRIYLDDGRIRYQYEELNEKHGHHHLVCDNCSSVEDLQEDLLEELEKQVQMKAGFKVLNHSVKLTGLCKRCMSKMENSAQV